VVVRQHKERPAIEIVDGCVIFDGFVEYDEEVVALIAAAPDREVCVHTLLGTGARVAAFMGVSREADVIERRLGEMTEAVQQAVEQALTQVSQTAEELFDADAGTVPATVASFKEELGDLLDATFDPDSKASAVSAMEDTVRVGVQKLLDAHLKQLRRAMDPDADDSPLARVVRAVKDHAAEVRKDLRELSEGLAASRATTEAMRRSAVKGNDYESVLFDEVSGIAAAQGDAAERVGRVGGALGTQKGDIVVTLDPEETRGLDACYAVEAKDKKLGLRATLDELDKAMTNRQAVAGIAVFASSDQAPTRVPFQPHGDKAIVVFDGEEPDPRALRLACLWARWVVKRSLYDVTEAVDVERLESLIEKMRRALGRATTMRRANSTVKKASLELGTHLDEMLDELEAALDAMCSELGKGAGNDG
jgi:hypothetical protein